MRIYLSVDMEGITGLVDADDVQPGGTSRAITGTRFPPAEASSIIARR